ncbi:endonuclease/exonuclease/phosphatase family protein, partial [uncultured Flavobacterium sp.]|uniref:endonuclease/exonuclease/phosphatase family protein n=1 Tax=uncultured Flavobacterium sp. TaxID=165435 RepID=UPI0030EE39ED
KPLKQSRKTLALTFRKIVVDKKIMKILTWNIERPKSENQLILEKLAEYNADIVILTETNSKIKLCDEYSFLSTENLINGYDGIEYKTGENRTTIWTKYKITVQHKTYDSFTSVCAKIETPNGMLTVYGTIIGVFGGIGERFKSDLENQLKDFENLKTENEISIIGDFNVTFSGRVYPSHDARNKLNLIFENLKLKNLTSEIENNVDHIVVSKSFIENKNVKIETWNHNKKLSDHIGICVTLE